MNPDKKRKLELGGWKVGDAADFLELSPEESALVESSLAGRKTTLQSDAHEIKTGESSILNRAGGLDDFSN